MLEKLTHDHPELLEKTAQHPADSTAPDVLGHKMLTLMCRATYCLVVPEFVGMATVRLDQHGALDWEDTPWEDPEELPRLLGDFVNIHPTTKEVNIQYSSMEEFFQAVNHTPAPTPTLTPSPTSTPTTTSNEPPLWYHISELKSQKSLAKIGAWFLGSKDFAKPLIAATCEPPAALKLGANIFKRFPGGMGRELNVDSHEMIAPMLERLERNPGLEYNAISFPFHARRAAYLEYRKTRKLTRTKETLLPLLDSWLTGNIQAEDACGQGNLRSWQEVHAFFCCEMPEDCACGSFPDRERFLTDLKLRFLLGVVPSTCLWCGEELPSIRPSGDSLDGDGEEDGILCRNCREHNKYFATITGTESQRSTKCSRVYRMFQNPDLLFQVEKAGGQYLVPFS